MKFSTIVMAAGHGTRMCSDLPKVLHPVAGKPMLCRILKTAIEAGSQKICVVINAQDRLIQQATKHLKVTYHFQNVPQGTADAVRSVPLETMSGLVLVLNGDHPLIEAEDIWNMLDKHKKSSHDLSIMSCHVHHPGMRGRLIRKNSELIKIVEAKKASANELEIKEINAGIYVGECRLFARLLKEVKKDKRLKEFCLTDIVTIARKHKKTVGVVNISLRESFGVNTQDQLTLAGKYLFFQKAKCLLKKGVIILDPQNTYIEDEVQVGSASLIYPGVYLQGNTCLGSHCVVESGCVLRNTKIQDHVYFKSGCYVEDSSIQSNVVLGPYAHVRKKSEIAQKVEIGNFVEIKNTKIHQRVKAKHLSYLGDADVGAGTNVGCGTVTCNYAVDKKKYKTKIGKNVFIGSGTQLIAPISLGDGAVIGSGSVITKKVPQNSLAISRSHQKIKRNYKVQKNLSRDEK